MRDLLIRWAGAIVLVTATWNPSGLSFVSWAPGAWAASAPLVALVGLILLIGYVIYVRATIRSIGPIGALLVAALVGILVWLLIDLGWLTTEGTNVLEWAGLIGLSLVLGVGLSWSLIRRRLSGQADVDDVDQME